MSTAETIDLMDLEPFTAGTDHALFARLRDEDPLHWNAEPDGPGFWSVTRYEDVKAVAANHEDFTVTEGTQIASRRAEGEAARSIHHVDPPEHSKLRGIVTPHIRPTKIKGLEADIIRVVDELLDTAIAAGEVDFVATVAAQLPLVMIGRLLGAPLADCPNLLRWTNQMASEDPDYSEGPETAVRARDEVFDYFRQLEKLRQQCPADDLVSVLVVAELDGAPLSRGYLDAYYLIMMVAGNETTRNLLSGGVAVLAEQPRWWEVMREDPATIRLVVEEMLRWVTPVLCMRRTATRDIEMHGKTIKAGDKVAMWFISGNRDDTVFEDPDRYWIERPNARRHMSFGFGIHRCMGNRLGELQLKILWEELLKRYPHVEVTGEPQRPLSAFVHGITALPVRISR